METLLLAASEVLEAKSEGRVAIWAALHGPVVSEIAAASEAAVALVIAEASAIAAV